MQRFHDKPPHQQDFDVKTVSERAYIIRCMPSSCLMFGKHKKYGSLRDGATLHTVSEWFPITFWKAKELCSLLVKRQHVFF
jgi:hypothetical protein